MAKAIFILGLAGSGKTYLADKLKNEIGAEICEGVAGNHHQKGIQEIIDYLKKGKTCTVEEVTFSFEDNRRKITEYILSQVPNAEIEWICFENDLESANWNVRNRLNKGDIEGHLRINEKLHKTYTYPNNAKIIKIKRIEKRHS